MTDAVIAENIEVEQALLGAILVNNAAHRMVSDFLQPDHFYEPLHRQIYDLMSGLITAGKLATPITLKTFLPTDVKIGALTLNQYMARLAAEATSVVNVVDYAKLIYDLADRRQIVDIGAHLAADTATDPVELAAKGVDALDQIVAKRSEGGSPSLTMAQAAVRALDAIAGAYQRDGRISGLTWGLRDMDSKTLGLQRQEVTILAGRPGMGKTAMGLGVAVRTAEAGNRVMFTSLEMGDISLTQRAIADVMFETKPTPYWVLRSGKFHEADFERIAAATERLGRLPMVIEQQSSLTLSQIAARARQMKRKQGLDLLVIDHLHLIKPSGRYAGNRVNELGEVSSGLKGLAKDLDIAVLALCQLNRMVETRDDKKPSMSDLRGSGDIEQDADTVIMLYREEYYLQRAEPVPGTEKYGEWQIKMERALNKLEALIEKQRNGPIGKVELYCNVACNAVRDAARAHDPVPGAPATGQGALF